MVKVALCTHFSVTGMKMQSIIFHILLLGQNVENKFGQIQQLGLLNVLFTPDLFIYFYSHKTIHFSRKQETNGLNKEDAGSRTAGRRMLCLCILKVDTKHFGGSVFLFFHVFF